MNDILEKIATIINRYESGEYLTTDRLREYLREITCNISYLTAYKIEAKNKHNEIEYKNKKGVGYGKILAHEQCPELYQTRYILRAAEGVKQSLIMELSIQKNES